VLQQVAEADYVNIIHAVAALPAHKLNVPILVMNKDDHRSAAQDMGTCDGRFVVSIGVSRKIYHPGKLQTHS